MSHKILMEFYDYPTNKPDKRGIYIALDSNGEYKPVYWSENKRRFSSWNMQAGKFLKGVNWNVKEWARFFPLEGLDGK